MGMVVLRKNDDMHDHKLQSRYCILTSQCTMLITVKSYECTHVTFAML